MIGVLKKNIWDLSVLMVVPTTEDKLSRMSLKEWAEITEWQMSQPRPLDIRIKMNEDRGSPWRMPLEGEKGVEGETLRRIEKMGEEIKLMIHQTMVRLKENATNI